MSRRKFNVVDIIIAVVIIALIALAGYKFGILNRAKSSGIKQEMKQTEFSLLVSDVRMATVNAFKVGDNIYDKKTNVLMGEITDVYYYPFTRTQVNNDGEVIQAEKVDYYNVIITVEGPVLEKDNGYFASGEMELKVNSEYQVYTRFAAPSARLKSINIEE